MTAVTEPPPRIATLDVLRGVAVMGILAMNIVAFAMPFHAYMNPAAFGGTEGADLWAWVLTFIFVDGKMRALFSILFGASMLLVIERADAAGQSGGKVHARRMLWLLAFGVAHYFLIWWGDILASYAFVGFVAYAFTGKNRGQLLKWSAILFGATFLLYMVLFASPLALQTAASAPGADPQVVQQWAALEAQLGRPNESVIARDIEVHQGSYFDIVHYKLTERAGFLAKAVAIFLPETLALMLLGMWGLKSGFLTGAWERRRYLKTAIICLGISIPAYALLALAIARSGFDTGTTLALGGCVASLFRPVMALGYASLIVLAVRGGASGAVQARISAAGRAAFTNYLGTSLMATFIFYGYGIGLYGELGRAESYLVVVGIWALMLLWSKPWLDRYRFGPFEWLWRSLARGRLQPMRKAIA